MVQEVKVEKNVVAETGHAAPVDVRPGAEQHVEVIGDPEHLKRILEHFKEEPKEQQPTPVGEYTPVPTNPALNLETTPPSSTVKKPLKPKGILSRLATIISSPPTDAGSWTEEARTRNNTREELKNAA